MSHLCTFNKGQTQCHLNSVAKLSSDSRHFEKIPLHIDASFLLEIYHINKVWFSFILWYSTVREKNQFLAFSLNVDQILNHFFVIHINCHRVVFITLWYYNKTMVHCFIMLFIIYNIILNDKWKISNKIKTYDKFSLLNIFLRLIKKATCGFATWSHSKRSDNSISKSFRKSAVDWKTEINK